MAGVSRNISHQRSVSQRQAAKYQYRNISQLSAKNMAAMAKLAKIANGARRARLPHLRASVQAAGGAPRRRIAQNGWQQPQQPAWRGMLA
jgi:hypothetical protein